MMPAGSRPTAPRWRTARVSRLEEAEALLRRVGTPSRINVPLHGKQRFRLTSEVALGGAVSFMASRCAGEWTLDAELDRFVVLFAPSAPARWQTAEADGWVTSQPTLFTPGRFAMLFQDEPAFFAIRFTRRAIEEAAARLWDVEHVHLRGGPAPARSDQHAAYWTEVLQYTRTFFASRALSHPALLSSLGENLAVSVLTAFPLIAERTPWRLESSAARAEFRRATSYIAAHAHEPIDAFDVARATRTPLAVLEGRFRAQRDGSISDALQIARVAGAHDDLVRLGPTPAVMTRTAERWRFDSVPAMLRLHTRHYPDWSFEFADRGLARTVARR